MERDRYPTHNARLSDAMNPAGAAPYRLGNLLVKAGVVTPQHLADAIRYNGTGPMQLGRTLVEFGHLSQKQLQYSLEAQSMIRDRAIDSEIGISALRLACFENISFQEALTKLGGIRKQAVTNRIGELLVESGVINEEDIHKALMKSVERNIPVGRQLVITSLISERTLSETLDCQLLMRENKLTRAEALRRIKARHLAPEPPALVGTGSNRAADGKDTTRTDIANPAPPPGTAGRGTGDGIVANVVNFFNKLVSR